jgi:ELWxxDGT repeat protein
VERIDYQWVEIFIPSSSDPQHLTNVNGTLYFSGSKVSYDQSAAFSGILKTDGTTVTEVKEIPSLEGFAALNGTLYFRTPGSTTDELWKSNGTAAGTVPVTSIGQPLTNTNDSNPANLTYVDGTLYFSAHQTSFARSLWKTNGTAAARSR